MVGVVIEFLFCFPVEVGRFLAVNRAKSIFAVVPNRFDRASVHGFHAKRFLFGGGGLLEHIGVAAIIAAREVGRCRLAAQVAVDALLIDVKLTSYVFRVFICNFSHKFSFVTFTLSHVVEDRAPGQSLGFRLRLLPTF